MPNYLQLTLKSERLQLLPISFVHLLEIIAIIEQCWAIHAVLGEYRLIKSIDPIASITRRRQGRFAGKLRVWIEQ